MFKCKVCTEKNLRISELKEQIDYLKKQLNPPPAIRSYEVQQDFILDGATREEVEPESEIDATSAELSKALENLEEDKIFSGNYDYTEQ